MYLYKYVLVYTSCTIVHRSILMLRLIGSQSPRVVVGRRSARFYANINPRSVFIMYEVQMYYVQRKYQHVLGPDQRGAAITVTSPRVPRRRHRLHAGTCYRCTSGSPSHPMTCRSP